MPKSAKSRTVQEPAELLEYLLVSWPDAKRTQIKSWLKHKAVTVNGRPVSQFNHRLRAGDVVALQADPGEPERRPAGPELEIYFEDPMLIVVEKPPNLLSIASDAERERTLYRQVTETLRSRKARSRDRIWIVHRLDRETSGLMVFAKTLQAKKSLQTGWDKAEKYYQAVVEGTMGTDDGTFASHLNETNPFRVFSARPGEDTREAKTHYRVLARGGGRTLVELRLVTGRRHQIRVHLADAGYPVVGDTKYGSKEDKAKRLALHSCRLAIQHPETRELLKFESPLPLELARLIPRKRR
jgi:23S rRNA pseudouridine1911/1915/1917 synthase